HRGGPEPSALATGDRATGDGAAASSALADGAIRMAVLRARAPSIPKAKRETQLADWPMRLARVIAYFPYFKGMLGAAKGAAKGVALRAEVLSVGCGA